MKWEVTKKYFCKFKHWNYLKKSKHYFDQIILMMKSCSISCSSCSGSCSICVQVVVQVVQVVVEYLFK